MQKKELKEKIANGEIVEPEEKEEEKKEEKKAEPKQKKGSK